MTDAWHATTVAWHTATSLAHELDLTDHIELHAPRVLNLVEKPGWHNLEDGVWACVATNSSEGLVPDQSSKTKLHECVPCTQLSSIRVTELTATKDGQWTDREGVLLVDDWRGRGRTDRTTITSAQPRPMNHGEDARTSLRLGIRA